jgi:hypothetical protein
MLIPKSHLQLGLSHMYRYLHHHLPSRWIYFVLLGLSSSVSALFEIASLKESYTPILLAGKRQVGARVR